MLYKIPNKYIQKEYQYLPAYLAGFSHAHYANLDELIDDANFANWVVGLFDMSGTQVQTIGAPTKDIISGSDFRFYFDFTIDAALSGNHFFAIYDSSDNSVVYQSNFFKVIQVEDTPDYAYLEFKNSVDLDNFNYSVFTSYNSVFLELNNVELAYEYEIKNYLEQSTGRTRTQKINKRKYLSLEVYLFDEEAYDAMFSLSDHDDVKINDEVVTLKAGFVPNKQKDMNIGKGTIEYYVQRFSTVNFKN